MHYFVITQDGQKFGPVDIMTLNKWVSEGRILPQTILEEAGTMRRLLANQVHGLALPNENPYQGQFQPSPANYPRIVDSKADKYASTAKAMGYIGLLLCPIFSVIGLVMGIMAYNMGSPKAKGAIITCVVTLGIYIVGYFVLSAALQSMMNGM